MRTSHAILLLVAFAVMIAASWAHQLYYLRTVNRLAAGERRPGRMLVSGRSPGRLRGAVALLVIRQADETVERALVMEGTTVFARFRDRPQLTGPADEAPEKEASKAARGAVRNAVEHYRRISAGGSAAPSGSSAPSDGPGRSPGGGPSAAGREAPKDRRPRRNPILNRGRQAR
jgi:glucitol operon activator protein